MALGTLVLGYCLMQFDNGTAPVACPGSLLAWRWCVLPVMHERRASGVDPVLWDSAAEMPDFGITCSTTTNWVSNMIIGAPSWHCLIALALPVHSGSTLPEHCVCGHHFLAHSGNQKCHLEHIERKLMAGEKLRNIGVCFTGRMCCTSGPFFVNRDWALAVEAFVSFLIQPCCGNTHQREEWKQLVCWEEWVGNPLFLLSSD